MSSPLLRVIANAVAPVLLRLRRLAGADELRPVQLRPVQLLFHALEGRVADGAVGAQRDQTIRLGDVF
jgi:hypothetical protein